MVRIYNFDECEEFLREHVPPEDIHHAFSLNDAMNWIRDGVATGDQLLIGDLERGVLFRLNVRNAKVSEVNMMGNALQLRSVAHESMKVLWERGVEQLMVFTQYKAMAGIVKRMGFEQRGYFPRVHWFGGRLVDVGVYCLEKTA